jgi:hypothetical protein
MVKIIGLFVINIEQTLVGTGLANGKILKVPLTQKFFFSLLKVLVEYSVLAKEFFDFIKTKKF